MRIVRERPDLRPATVAISAGRGSGEPGDPLNVPVHLTSVFRTGGEIEYAREANPTWSALEEVLGALEGGQALAFASGIGALAAILETLPVGATVVAPHDAYSGLRSLLGDLLGNGRMQVRFVAVDDTDATLEACRGADLLLVESPTNPMLAVADLEALAEGAGRLGVPLAVDNTFATPLLQRPLDLGAAIVAHSATKLLAGHSDVVLGATVTRDDRWHSQLELRRRHHGAIPGPLEAWLVLRGLRTLPLRLERGQANATELAERLRAHPAVERVRYPGFATIVSFDVVGGAPAADRVCTAVRLIGHATSLGGVESTMERRNAQPGEEQVPPGLIRLSVGCEDVEDLWADLDAALTTTGKRP